MSDGTLAGTVMVLDIQPGAGDSSPRYFTALNGLVYFAANDGSNGEELWQTDGTAGLTVLVDDIKPGNFSSSPELLTTSGGRLYFTAEDGVSGRELWVE